MSVRFFLGTNIFACTFDFSAPAKARRASELIGHALETGHGVVSYQVVQEFFNLSSRRFPSAFSPIEAEQYLGTVFSPMLAVHSSSALYREALR